MKHDCAREALAGMRDALAGKPDVDQKALTRVTRNLTQLREALLSHAPQPIKTIEGVNGVISQVLAIQYPIGKVPWQELESAKDWLSEAAERDEI